MKEGAFVGPSLPLIVPAVSRSSPFLALPRAEALSQLALIRSAYSEEEEEEEEVEVGSDGNSVTSD